MPVFLSPGVFPREIDLSVLPNNSSGLIPAFIGTAQKGPMNEPKFITNAEQFVEQFGNPLPEANLGYAVMAYLEEGNAVWVLRVGVQCDEVASVEQGDDGCLAGFCFAEEVYHFGSGLWLKKFRRQDKWQKCSVSGIGGMACIALTVFVVLGVGCRDTCR